MSDEDEKEGTLALTVARELRPKTVGGRYVLLGLLGSGAMGTVYRARDGVLDETVALKMLRRDCLLDTDLVERFHREVKLARRVTHTNVARVFDIGDDGGDRYLTMEYVKGESLASRIARAPIPLPDALSIASGICAGLSCAHEAGVVHRDLKPGNVMLEAGGRVVLTDFGIARALDGGAAVTGGGAAIVGTPAYMAPEQILGADDVDARADIYALGAVLFELFTGRRAWRGHGPVLVGARFGAPPPDPRDARPDLPAAYAEIVQRCMQPRREDRFASAREVAAALSELTVAGAPARARATTPPRASEAPRAARAVAVLPFANAGPEGDAYLAEELTDEVIDTLSMTHGLRVASRGLVRRYDGRSEDARGIGRELGVDAVVEGSLRKRGDDVRVVARVIGVADGFQIWAKRFDRPAQDLLLVSDEVAAAIAAALTLDARELRRDALDAVAVDLYLRGRHASRRFAPDSLERSIALFEQALARAPEDGTVLAALATARARRAFFAGEGIEAAREAAERALAVAPERPEPYAAFASVEMQSGSPAAAVSALRAAIARGPGLAEAHATLGRILCEAGAVEPGVRWLDIALSLDPLVPLAHPQLARTYALLGEEAKLDAQLEALTAVEGALSAAAHRARFVLWRGDRDAAERLLAAIPVEAEADEATRLPRAILELMTGRRVDETLASIARFAASPDVQPRRRAFFGQLHAEVSLFLGDAPAALASLGRAVDAGLFDLLWIERCPILEPLRASSAFLAHHAAVSTRAAEIVATYRA